MINFQGSFLDGKSSRALPVTISCDGESVRIHGEGDVLVTEAPLQDVVLTPPLGRAQRALMLPGGGRCETADLAAFAELEAQHGGNLGMRFVHRLESRWPVVLGCLVGLVAAVWGFTSYGIPLLAARAAYATPPELVEGISERTLRVLDDRLLYPSELEPERKAEVRAQFKVLDRQMGASEGYRLVFRRGGPLGANALALPSGLVIVTDELARLAQNDLELSGVLAHEIAHVEMRHGLKSIYQSAGVFLLISVLAGDVASATSVATSLPVLLIDAGYSKAFELEADEAAGRFFLEQGGSTRPYRNMLYRLSHVHSDAVPSMLSTHPGAEERIAFLKELEAAFNSR